MAAFLTTFGFAKLTDFEVGSAALTIPPIWYVGLSLAVADKLGTLLMPDGTGAEVTGAGYQRVAVTNNLTNFPAAVSSFKTNGTAITFARPTGTWGLVLSAFLADASGIGAGNVWRTFDLTTACNLTNASAAPSFPAGCLYFARS